MGRDVHLLFMTVPSSGSRHTSYRKSQDRSHPICPEVTWHWLWPGGPGVNSAMPFLGSSRLQSPFLSHGDMKTKTPRQNCKELSTNESFRPLSRHITAKWVGIHSPDLTPHSLHQPYSPQGGSHTTWLHRE